MGIVQQASASGVKVRQSNFEMLRIVAMFMVLVLHVDSLANGRPAPEDISSAPFPSFLRIMFEVMCVGCVDLFVLISGWFGIKANRRSLGAFVFQVVFVFYIVAASCWLFGGYVPDYQGGGNPDCNMQVLVCSSLFGAVCAFSGSESLGGKVKGAAQKSFVRVASL